MRAHVFCHRSNDDKIRVVLNKADSVPTQALMRVYGAMMWSLGKVINTPEVMRVYIGSFWDQPIKNEQLLQLFTNEMQDLVSDLKSVPRNGVLRKINELVKRARMAKVHSYIISHMREQMPFMGKKRKQQQMIQNLEDVFYDVKRKYDLVLGDFPGRWVAGQVRRMQSCGCYARVGDMKTKVLGALGTCTICFFICYLSLGRCGQVP